MCKFMILLGMMISHIACAQQEPIAKEQLYPYLDREGQFGYVDENLQMRIQPQYKTASLFTEQGFAVITDSLDRKGVIDKNNKVIITADYDAIQLYALNNATIAEVYRYYYTRWRFWEWEFLPGFSFMGSGDDGRLFDTKVKRLKKTVFVLGDKPKKVKSERLTDKGYVNKYFNIKTLDSNQILIDGSLYTIGVNGERLMASNIKDPITKYSFAQEKDKHLYIIDHKGKRINEKAYTLLDSITFKVEGVPVGKHLARDYAPIASAYQNTEGLVFIYPDFSKPLPQHIHDNRHPDDPSVEELIRGLWMLASVPDSDYFIFMSFRDGKRFFRFLDTQGNWHKTIPSHIPFTVVLPSGNIIWPAREHYILPLQVPEGWKIDRITALKEDSLYHITLQRDKEVRQGVWDFNKKQWLITPDYYEVYLMDNTRCWRFHSEYGGLWGVMDHNGTVLIEPTYSTLRSDGWVTQKESGKYISFYLHPQTLEELREK